MTDFSKYDAGINDGTTNLDLIAFEDDSTKPKTETLPPRPPKQDVPNASEFEQSPTYGDIFGQGDFSSGAGQRRFHSAGRDTKKFWYADGLDISDPGKLRLLHDVGTAVSSATIGKDVEVANDLPFVIDNTGSSRVKRGDGAFPGTWTPEDPGGGATNADALASSGDQLFAAQVHVYRRSSAGTWSLYLTKASANVDRIAWLKGRLVVTDGSNIYEVTSSGGTLGTTFLAMETLPSGWRFEAIWELGEFIYASAISSVDGRSSIHHYGLNQAVTALEKKGETDMPKGTLIFSGGSYLGFGYIGGGVLNGLNASSTHGIVYLTIQDSRGFLTIVKLDEDRESLRHGQSTSTSVRCFEPWGESMYYGWPCFAETTASSVRNGIAVHHLARDAVVNHLTRNVGGGTNITAVKVYRGRLMFIAAGDGLIYEDISKYKGTGFLLSSFADFNNAGQKIWDLFEVSHAAIATAQHVKVDGVFDPEAIAYSAILDSATVGEFGKTVTDISNTLKGRTLRLMLTLVPGTSQLTTPILYTVSARSNLAPVTLEYVLTRSFRLFEQDQKDDNAMEVFRNPDTDLALLRGMVNKWVTFSEPNKAWTAFVVAVSDVRPIEEIVRTSGGDDQSRKGYVIQMQMVAR